MSILCKFSPFAANVHELPHFKATTPWLLWIHSAQSLPGSVSTEQCPLDLMIFKMLVFSKVTKRMDSQGTDCENI